MAGRLPSMVRIRKTDADGDLTATGVALNELPAAPSNLGAIGKRAYQIIISELAEIGAISPADTLLIVPAARAYERWFVLDEKITSGAAPELEPGKSGKLFMSGVAQARSAALGELRKLLGDLGVGPLNRYRVQGSAQSDFLGMLDAPMPRHSAKPVETQLETPVETDAPDMKDNAFKPLPPSVH